MTPIEQMINGCGLEPTGEVHGTNVLPVLTHRGKLAIGPWLFECGRLSNGKTIFFGEEFENFMFEMTKHE
jgi:hypothetical protein